MIFPFCEQSRIELPEHQLPKTKYFQINRDWRIAIQYGTNRAVASVIVEYDPMRDEEAGETLLPLFAKFWGVELLPHQPAT